MHCDVATAAPERKLREERLPLDEPIAPDPIALEPTAVATHSAPLWDRLGASVEWVLGGATMLLLLAVVATIPILQVLTLGYLLEVSGRVARTGHLAAGFFGYRQAARIGSVLVGIGATLFPLWLLAEQAASANVIDPAGFAARDGTIRLIVAAGFAMLHVAAALYSGGRLRDFFWLLFQPLYGPAASAWAWFTGGSISEPWTWLPPLKLAGDLLRGEAYGKAADGLWEFVVSLRLPYLFQLGLLGFVGTFVWIAIPAALLGVARFDHPVVAFVAGLLGTILSSIVLLHLPFLQAHYAAEQSFWALFDIAAVRAQFQRAPLLFWLALIVTLTLSLPLYLLAAYPIPRELAWVPAFLSILCMLPARLLTGWAVGRGRSREELDYFWRWSFWVLEEEPAHFLRRPSFWAVEVPLVVIYTLFILCVPYLSSAGSAAHFRPPAFLIP